MAAHPPYREFMSEFWYALKIVEHFGFEISSTQLFLCRVLITMCEIGSTSCLKIPGYFSFYISWAFISHIYIYIYRFQRRNSFVTHGGMYSLITHSTLGLLAVEYSVAAELYTPRGPSTQIPLGGTVLQLSKLVNSEKISEGSIFYHFNTVIMSDASCNPIPHCCDQGLWRHNCLIIVRRFGFKLTNCIDF